MSLPEVFLSELFFDIDIGCTLVVHWLYIGCIMVVHWLYIGCTLVVHSLYNVHDCFTNCTFCLTCQPSETLESGWELVFTYYFAIFNRFELGDKRWWISNKCIFIFLSMFASRTFCRMQTGYLINCLKTRIPEQLFLTFRKILKHVLDN